MRYFKYTAKIENDDFRSQYADLTKNEGRNSRKEKVLGNIAILVFVIVSFICLIACLFAILRIPEPSNAALAILFYIGTGVLVLVSIILSLLIGTLASSPLFSKAYRNEKDAKRKLLSEACAHLRDYYEVQEPCIVTKCYDSSDKRFVNRDVCVFVVGEELRITTNLIHGFFHSENDLGCYAFSTEELYMAKREGDGYLMAEIKADGVFFLLGYRAKGFVEKNFISKRIPT